MFINCHTYYSLRYGLISEESLLEVAQKSGAKTVVLSDVNNTSACLNFVRLAPKYNIKPIIGIDFRYKATQYYLGIAQNNEGFHALNTFLSHHSHTKKDIPQVAPDLPNVIFIYPFEHLSQIDKMHFRANEYIGIGLKDIRKLAFSQLSTNKEKLIILNSYTFRNKKDYNTHRLLRAMDENVLLSKLPVDHQANEHDVFRDNEQIQAAYKNYPHILENTERLLHSCSIFFDFSQNKKPQNKLYFTDNKAQDEALIEKLCQEGLPYRYTHVTDKIRKRIHKELTMIKNMDYVSFFLINWDIISYAKSKGYFHVGRGSGANSIVAYLLGITDVDPIELDLYFERFMNLYRSTPPDFDIDFSSRDRDDVTRYIFERFGARGQAALLATYNTFKHSAAVRELGKVFGLPKEEIDKLSDGKYIPEKLDKLSALVLRYAKHIKGMPNYLSVHSAGILISEKPIHYFSATDLPPKGYPTTQFDMVVAEDVGLYKYDILGQRGLGKIKDSLEIIKYNRPELEHIDIHNVKPFLTDKKVNKLVSEARCIGCFYVESPAMRMLLKKLSVDNYLGLVAASSIIRPGVAKSGMMREYILRHKNPERRKQAHPVMWNLMADTYGVMVYQEDVIKVAHHFAGLTLGEADVLRRGMSGKYRSREEFLKVKRKFVSNCREKGYTDQLTMEVWRQIESFAGYAFAKGHSASYAIESYQSLYLKTYFPLEYMVAVLNNGGGFYRPELYVHEARIHGAKVHAPCINKSDYKTIISGTDIYLGFQHLKGIDTSVILRILQDRHNNGDFLNFVDFLDRIIIGIEPLDILIRANTFRFTNKDKRTLLWNGHYYLNKSKSPTLQAALFKSKAHIYKLPTFEVTLLENAFDEIELFGFCLCNPFLLLKDPVKNKITAKDLATYTNKTITIYGYLVTVKNTRTSDGKRMYFGTFLDQSGAWLDTVHFPPVAAKYPFRGKGVYAVRGKVVEEFGFLTIEAAALYRLAYVEDPRYADNTPKNDYAITHFLS